MYIRMTFRAVEVYELLEPLLNDYRKLRMLSMCTYAPILSIRDRPHTLLLITLVPSRIQSHVHGRVHRQAPPRRTRVRYHLTPSSQTRGPRGDGEPPPAEERPHGRYGG
jgi:PRP38 family